MASHGCTQPNPYIFEIEKQKRKALLGHEIGAGARCRKCKDKCPGFSLHYWRKVCQNCRCPKEEHEVVEQHDPGIVRIGKLFDRPLRTKEEELSYCYGTDLLVCDPSDPARKQVKLKFDWIPPGTSLGLARKYMEQLPKEKQPIEGSVGAFNRRRQLEVQIPSYDMDFSKCQGLTHSDKEGLEKYLQNLKTHVVGQGIIKENSHDTNANVFHLSEMLSSTKLSPEASDNIINEVKSFKMVQEKPWTGTASIEAVNLNQKQIGQPLTKLPHGNLVPETMLNTTPPQKQNNGNAQPEPNANKELQTPLKSWQCEECKGNIEVGDVAVFAERAGAGKCWHPNCFTCAVCKELLVDLIYFYLEGKVYCGRHFSQKLKIPRCKACDELIFSKEYTRAEDSDWHIDHFCCWGCDKPLAEQKYIIKDSNPLCLDCYRDKFGKQCMTCSQQIPPESQRVMMKDYCWHATPECFKCFVCHKSLLKSQFLLKKEHIFCSKECKATCFPNIKRAND